MRAEDDVDVPWVAGLAACEPGAADRHVQEAGRERRLFNHIAAEHAKEGRASYIEIDAPLELYAIVRLVRPRHVVEVGVSSGVSSAYLLQALERNEHGTLHSIDRPKRTPSRPRTRPASNNPSWSLPPGRESGWAVPESLRRRWDLRIGDKSDIIPLLTEELDRVDLFVYDVPHDDRRSQQEFFRLDSRLTRNGIAIVDHGPGGGLCPALAQWARWRNATPSGRAGLGLYGFRSQGRPGRWRTVSARGPPRTSRSAR
jgi:Methyltransferase domain